MDKAHKELHNKGAETFERRYGVDLRAMAEQLAAMSPHRWRWMDD